MPEGRERVPAELERALFLEVGHRCAIPTCPNTDGLEIEHIEDYAVVKRHEFHNMIVLCAICHSRKMNKSNPRHLDRKALRQYKANLALLNARYSAFERRVMEYFALMPDQPMIKLGGVGATLDIELMYLRRDGMLLRPVASTFDNHVTDIFGQVVKVSETFLLTDKGRALLERWKTAQPIEQESGDA